MIETDSNGLLWYLAAHEGQLVVVLSALFLLLAAGALLSMNPYSSTVRHGKALSFGALIAAILLGGFLFVQDRVNSAGEAELSSAIEAKIGLAEVNLSKIAQSSGPTPAITYYGVGIDGNGEPRQFEAVQYEKFALISETGVDSFGSLHRQGGEPRWYEDGPVVDG